MRRPTNQLAYYFTSYWLLRSWYGSNMKFWNFKDGQSFYCIYNTRKGRFRTYCSKYLFTYFTFLLTINFFIRVKYLRRSKSENELILKAINDDNSSKRKFLNGNNIQLQSGKTFVNYIFIQKILLIWFRRLKGFRYVCMNVDKYVCDLNRYIIVNVCFGLKLYGKTTFDKLYINPVTIY